MASTNNLVMEKQAQQLALKCPRCDSSNTKFCYYNNYSLLQPRYFCKGCKRYWTRGGTLRNVPVGGGGRKNKRVKKVAVVPPVAPVDYVPPSTSIPMTSTTTITNPNSSSGHSRINNIFPLLYGLHSNVSSSDHNLSFTRFDSALYNNIQQPDEVNVLGFSSASRMATTDVSTSESIFSNYVATTPMFRSCNSSISVSPTMTSLIKPNYLDQENSVNPDCNNVFSFVPDYVDMQMQGNNSIQTRSNQMEATNDQDSLFCVGGWFDSANIGFSPFDLATMTRMS